MYNDTQVYTFTPDKDGLLTCLNIAKENRDFEAVSFIGKIIKIYENRYHELINKCIFFDKISYQYAIGEESKIFKSNTGFAFTKEKKIISPVFNTKEEAEQWFEITIVDSKLSELREKHISSVLNEIKEYLKSFEAVTVNINPVKFYTGFDYNFEDVNLGRKTCIEANEEETVKYYIPSARIETRVDSLGITRYSFVFDMPYGKSCAAVTHKEQSELWKYILKLIHIRGTSWIT